MESNFIFKTNFCNGIKNDFFFEKKVIKMHNTAGNFKVLIFELFDLLLDSYDQQYFFGKLN
jgi:hypothetical protein